MKELIFKLHSEVLESNPNVNLNTKGGNTMENTNKVVPSESALALEEFHNSIISQFISEMSDAVIKAGFTLNDDQLAQLRGVYNTVNIQAEGRSSLESFFNSIPLHRIKELDVSSFTYVHIIKWCDMLLFAGFNKVNMDTVAGCMKAKILEMIIRRMPKCLKSKLWMDLADKFPEKVADFYENYESIAQCPSCARTGWALMSLPVPVPELIDVMSCDEPCPYPDSFLERPGYEHALSNCT